MPDLSLLPLSTKPWRTRIERRHQPPELAASSRQGYRKLLPCLRWEFGFSCAFCLLHEADFQEHGTKGSGLMSIEHAEPVGTDPAKANLYKNCFYACRYCNQARGSRPVADLDRRLLNPCDHAWGDFFTLHGFEILQLEENPDALYTLESYHLNDPRKLAHRRFRRETLEEALAVVGQFRAKSARLIALAAAKGDPELVDLARLLRSYLKRAWQDLDRFLSIPRDVEGHCACPGRHDLNLPQALQEQVLERPAGSAGA